MMSEKLNIKLKDGVDPSVLLKYGFVPKYSEDTGEIKKYVKRIHIDGKKPDEKHFTFVLHTEHLLGGLFTRTLYYNAWMTGFHWDDLCSKEALQLLYDLIIDKIVEPADETLKNHNN